MKKPNHISHTRKLTLRGCIVEHCHAAVGPGEVVCRSCRKQEWQRFFLTNIRGTWPEPLAKEDGPR